MANTGTIGLLANAGTLAVLSGGTHDVSNEGVIGTLSNDGAARGHRAGAGRGDHQ